MRYRHLSSDVAEGWKITIMHQLNLVVITNSLRSGEMKVLWSTTLEMLCQETDSFTKNSIKKGFYDKRKRN